MGIRFRKGILILQDSEGEPEEFSAWGRLHAGHVFRLRENKGGALICHSLGPEEEACRLPINITSRSPGVLRLISNFAETPFVLDGAHYQSIEGFWQGLKFPDEQDRRRLALLHGSKAKDEGYYAPKSDVVIYAGEAVPVGAWEHWQLMEKACKAKFEQSGIARSALLSTGRRPLEHRMKHDSRTIPGVIMADIWMRIRAAIQSRTKANQSTAGVS